MEINIEKIHKNFQIEVEKLKKICQEIGCSGLSPKMCKEEPHKCDIIRKFILGQKGE